MTRKEIISRLGWLNLRHIDDSPDSILSRIEKLVADVEAAEREACAKLADQVEMLDYCAQETQNIIVRAIRARGAKQSCPKCFYQHGHAIGCVNNPVDIALSARGAA